MACALLMMAFALFYMFLIRVPVWDMLYFGGLALFLCATVFFGGFAVYVWRVHRLKECGDRLRNEGTTLPEGRDAFENLYQEMIEDLNVQRKVEDSAHARKLSEMREYYAMWVHQIKTPIAAMQLLLQVQRNRLEAGELLQTNENAESVESQTEVKEAAAKEALIAEQLQIQSELEGELFDIEQYVNMALQYQRVNAPGNDYVLAHVRLDDIVREVIRKYAKLMVRRHIPLRYEGTDVMVTTDDKWVAFAIEQVLSNAIKYSKEGQPIEIETVQEPNWDYLKITDHGIGISQEDVTRVFEKGYTGYNEHSDKKSTGIGLYLSKLVLNKLGHNIRLESEYGVGTMVWIGFQKRKK